MSELDEALERFRTTSWEWGGGFANHGPMACEALVELGHHALVPAFVERYAPRLPPRPEGKALPPADREAVLGEPTRCADWIATFEAELAEKPWRTVLAESLPRLASGVIAAAGHGWLRTAHAVRALGAEETEVRRAELAQGLGYWAAHHEVLPGRPSGDGSLDFAEALHVFDGGGPLDPTRQLSDGVAELGDALADAVGRVGWSGTSLGMRIHRLCVAVAERYLGSARGRIGHTHAITIPSALRLVEPVLPDACEELFPWVWQASAALCALCGGPGDPLPDDPEAERLAGDPAEIRYRAACSAEEHAIKLTEACLREDAFETHPILRRVAADAALRIGDEPGRIC